MSETAGTVHPPVSWAQRNDLLYVIIDVECKDIEHKVTDTSFTFKGVNALDATKKYEVTLNFLHPIDPQRVTSKNIGRCLEFTIYKKESGAYWPSLTNDKSKLHFLKANFSKWKNESDDEDAEPDAFSFDNMMNSNQNWNNKFDDMDLEDDDSDDNIPSLSKNDEDSDDEKDEKTAKKAEEDKEKEKVTNEDK